MVTERVRPSLLQGLAPAVLGVLSVGGRLTLGADWSNKMVSGMEKTVQDEFDE